MSPRDGIAVSLAEPPAQEAAPSPIPLSSQQARWWEHHQLEPDGRHNVTVAVDLDGPLDLAWLLAGLDALAARHDLLRTAFTIDGSRPQQSVRPAAPQELLMIDLRGCD